MKYKTKKEGLYVGSDYMLYRDPRKAGNFKERPNLLEEIEEVKGNLFPTFSAWKAALKEMTFPVREVRKRESYHVFYEDDSPEDVLKWTLESYGKDTYEYGSTWPPLSSLFKYIFDVGYRGEPVPFMRLGADSPKDFRAELRLLSRVRGEGTVTYIQSEKSNCEFALTQDKESYYLYLVFNEENHQLFISPKEDTRNLYDFLCSRTNKR